MNRAIAVCPALLTALIAPGWIVSAQEPEEQPGRLEELENELEQRDPKQQEMMDLFAEVERNLLQIDDLLFEAAAGEDDLELMESGLSELFLSSRERSREVAEGIDRILDLAEQMQSEQKGSGQGSGQSQGQDSNQGQGDSPLDNRGSESQREKESSSNDPSAGQQGENSRGPDPRDGLDQDGQSRPEESTGSEAEGSNQDGDQAGEDPLGAGNNPREAGQWGELPPRVQEIFSNQVSDDLPLEYRDFIESYWLRLQREG